MYACSVTLNEIATSSEFCWNRTNGEPLPGVHTAESANVVQLFPAGMAGTARLTRSKCTMPPGSGLWAVTKSIKGVAIPAGKSLIVSCAEEPTVNTSGSRPDSVYWTTPGGFVQGASEFQLMQTLPIPSKTP